MSKAYVHVKWDVIDEHALRAFSSHNVWRWLIAVALEWFLIAAAIAVCLTWPRWWVWVLGALLIGTRQHGLSILAHEGAHHLVARSQIWNDLFTNYLTTYWLAFPVQGYRTTHLKHHWYLETPDDPTRVTLDRYPGEWTFPMSTRRFIGMFIRDLTLRSQRAELTLMQCLWDVPGKRVPHVAGIVLLHSIVIAIAAWSGQIWAYVFLWLVPLCTVTVACYRLRSLAEHSVGPQSERYARSVVDNLRSTRTTTGSALSQFLLYPHNISYHIEHHMFPSVSAFRLRGLHETLLENPVYANNAHITHGHWELIAELTRHARRQDA
ncbi:MAG TPA: fatty acid desaturase family protein [Thermoanaerobaculia bacterium]|nr:fatty acid desaturase family protein [Thermoanaerobaculia bacterium]